MILTLFAIATGSIIGRARGGRGAGVGAQQLRSSSLLVVAIACVLVQAILNPVFPFLWSLVGVGSLIGFGIRNRHLTGMSIVLIGATLNLLVLLANGATPVSELALTSVGDLNPFGLPDIDGARESSATATRLRFLGDAIPVPLFGNVVSIGDIIALVGLADIFTNLFLTARNRELALDDAGVSFGDATSRDRISIMSPKQVTGRGGAHASHRRPRLKAAPSSHVPAHAAQSLQSEDPSAEHTPAHAAPSAEPVAPSAAPAHAASPEPTEPTEALVIDLEAPAHGPGLLDASTRSTKNGTAKNGTAKNGADPVVAAGMHAVPVSPTTAPTPIVDELHEVIDLTDPNDPRPIIDLTKSPTDEQMTEFLRRRKAADRDHSRVPIRPPGQRRGRAPVRIRTDRADGVVETAR